VAHRYRVRKESLPDDALIVLRGGLLEFNSLRADADAAATRFGLPGISVFGAPDDAAVEKLGATRLVRFDVLTLVTAGDIRTAGLEVLPTFRRPHYTVLLPDLVDDLYRLLACDTVVRINPSYRAPEG